MKVHLVSVLDGIDNLGFRRFAAYVKTFIPDVKMTFVIPGNYRNPLNLIFARGESRVDEEEVDEIATILAEADLVGFSSMTGYAPLVKKIIAAIRQKSPDTYIVWGGIHAIMEPEDAVIHADAVCTGEGEFAFQKLFETLKAGEAPLSIPSFCFKTDGGLKRNHNMTLLTSDEMTSFPFPIHQDGETLFKKGQGIVEMTGKDFIRFNGITNPMIWTIGCPLKCTYCGNSRFIENDPKYRRLRRTSVDHLIGEIKHARSKHPFISEITFHDDSFMALPIPILEEFSEKYKAEVGLPFFVAGVIPNYVREDKIEVLLDAGMNRVRMGVQTGSQRVLDFYERPTPVAKIENACRVINKYKKYMIPPAFDIILDNPIEKKEDTQSTINLLYNMPRPFTLNLTSLTIYPNTVLADRILKSGIDPSLMTKSFYKHNHSLGNCLVYLLTIWKIPRKPYEYLLARVKPSHEKQPRFWAVSTMLRTAYFVKRAFQHLRSLDFTTLPGWTGFILWKLGIINWWRRNLVSVYTKEQGADPENAI